MRIATIDLGTNTFLLLIAEIIDGELRPVHQEQAFVRLGRGVDRTGLISDAAIERGLLCLRNYCETAKKYSAAKIAACGTSALRDASNSADFLELIEKELGLKIQIISGEEEARLSLLGALSNKSRLQPPVYMLDIGGGSTEMCWGEPNALQGRFSLNIGCVRLTERYLLHDPPLRSEMQTFRREVENIWQANTHIELRQGALVGVDGTVTTLAMLHQKLQVYDANRVDGSILHFNEIQKITALLAGKSVAERKGIMRFSPQRADVILAGALILEEAMRLMNMRQIIVSDRGLRFGMAQEVLNLG